MSGATGGVKLVGTSRNDEIQTTDSIYDWLDRRFCFDYDAFASHANFKHGYRTRRVPIYSTVEGTFTVGSNAHLISSNDGFDFDFDWTGRRVFCNPPYSGQLFTRAIDKMVAEKDRAAIIVALVKVDTSTARWRKLTANAHIEYLDRVPYEYADGRSTNAATFASAIAILIPDRNGWNWKRRRKNASSS